MRRLEVLLTVFTLAGLAPLSLASDHCVQVPQDTDSPAVQACETTLTYEYDIVGQRYIYDKASYQTALRVALRAWLEGTRLENEPGIVELWLAVPEANPQATQMRAFVRTRLANFVAYLSLHPQAGDDSEEGWHVTNATVGILDKDAYPETFGYRAGGILVKATAAASPAEIEEFMARHGATMPELFTPRWWSFIVDPFNERRAIAKAVADPMQPVLIERLAENSISEWIATRQKAFTFSLQAP